jgi:acyl carrier protein
MTSKSSGMNSSGQNSRATPEQIEDWLAKAVAKALNAKPEEIDVNVSFDRYGLDSAAAVAMAGDLGDWLGRDLPPTLLYDHPTIRALSAHLAQGA